MNKLLKAAAIGFLAAVALALVPFVFRFIAGIALILFIARMIFGHRRRRYWQGYARHMHPHNPVPVDGNWYTAGRQQSGPLKHVNIH